MVGVITNTRCNKVSERNYAERYCTWGLECNFLAVSKCFMTALGTKNGNVFPFDWMKSFYCPRKSILRGKCVQSMIETNRRSILHSLRFCHIEQWQRFTQHATQRRPAGRASILPHCSFTTGCQWHRLNNVNCSNQRVIQFKSCFTLLAASLQTRTNTHVHKSNVNMQAASPSAPGDSSVCTASL